MIDILRQFLEPRLEQQAGIEISQTALERTCSVGEKKQYIQVYVRAAAVQYLYSLQLQYVLNLNHFFSSVAL